MIDTFQQNFEIRQIHLGIKSQREKVEAFLETFELRLEDVDYYAGVFVVGEDDLLGCGGLQKDIIKCIAISNDLQDTGLGMKLISHLYTTALNNGATSVKVFTKPKNKAIFESLAFHTIASAEQAILLENGNGLKDYCKYLSSLQKSGENGAIVMNANPFSKGHRYLIEQASKQVDNLYVIVVKEDKSLFSYDERKQMIELGTKDIANVVVCEGSDYSISAATFPTYFLKELSYATDTQIQLDLSLFCNYIAKALNITKRFAGSEPTDKLTARYNVLMKEILAKNDIQFIEIERLEQDNAIVNATAIRQYLFNNNLKEATKYAFPTTIPYLLSFLASQSLQKELDTTPKPGLVDKKDNGAHSDMDYDLMCKSITTLHPYFTKLALLGYNNELAKIEDIQAIGLEAEKKMFVATNNVNTHKGALFSMGLCVVSSAHLLYKHKKIDIENLRKTISNIALQFPETKNTHGSKVLEENNIKGALQNARDAYDDLFSLWLPYYTDIKQDEFALHKTLLYIMTTLEDTNIYYRKGIQRAKQVQKEAKELLENFSCFALEKMNKDYIKDNVSPGGAADMLSLTLFIESLL